MTAINVIPVSSRSEANAQAIGGRLGRLEVYRVWQRREPTAIWHGAPDDDVFMRDSTRPTPKSALYISSRTDRIAAAKIGSCLSRPADSLE